MILRTAAVWLLLLVIAMGRDGVARRWMAASYKRTAFRHLQADPRGPGKPWGHERQLNRRRTTRSPGSGLASFVYAIELGMEDDDPYPIKATYNGRGRSSRDRRSESEQRAGRPPASSPVLFQAPLGRIVSIAHRSRSSWTGLARKPFMPAAKHSSTTPSSLPHRRPSRR